MVAFSIAVVGGGPRCTYAIERLAATIPTIARRSSIEIHVFDSTGWFGAGQSHSEVQLQSSLLNRIAAQITFAADESNADARELLAPEHRPTFAQWCEKKYVATGEDRFCIPNNQAAPRYLHGMALSEMFSSYVERLEALDGVRVHLHHMEVIDIEPGARLTIHCAAGESTTADRVLVATGHSWSEPSTGAQPRLVIPFPYPLIHALRPERVPVGARVGVRGMGLTAIDVCLALTEGRGGCFVTHDDGQLSYVSSGSEPCSIVCFSPSGTPPLTRPDNNKWSQPARHEHRGRYFTHDAVRRLRRAFGRPAVVAGKLVRQLDFDRHVYPLVLLEMAHVYYRTLLGRQFADRMGVAVAVAYERFLSEDGALARGVDALREPVDRSFDAATSIVARGLTQDLADSYSRELVRTYCSVVFGQPSPPQTVDPRSKWRHPIDVYAHRFTWADACSPLSPDLAESADAWHGSVVSMLHADILAARQGNLENPLKAACDGVWRDLRSAFGAVLDRGGLSPGSQRRFDEVYWRQYNRLSNGAPRESMAKFLALIRSGQVDVSIGPGPQLHETRSGFEVRGGRTGAVREVDLLIEGHLHGFDARNDHRPLYPNLLRRGLIREWRNAGAGDEPVYVPGALDLDDEFHPIGSAGTIERRLTMLGAPVERLCYFQLALARPHSNSAILNDVARWTDEIDAHLSTSACALRTVDAPPITQVRSRVRALLERESASTHPRDIIVLAIDGVRLDDARRSWRTARTEAMSSVFPTTSSCAWLSSLSGEPVHGHGVPGVVFRIDSELVNIFEYTGALPSLSRGNLFRDGGELGYEAVALLGDLGDMDSTWRRRLLEWARVVSSPRYYTRSEPPNADVVCRGIVEAVEGVERGERPRLVWLFVDLDLHIHRNGYDAHTFEVLAGLEEIAQNWSRGGALVVAYSDHGLVETRHSAELERLLATLTHTWGCELGGAGRTRWIYAPPPVKQAVHRFTRDHLPAGVRLFESVEVFPRALCGRAEIGDFVLVAEGDSFLAPEGYRYEHGSWTDAEIHVPLAIWGEQGVARG